MFFSSTRGGNFAVTGHRKGHIPILQCPVRVWPGRNVQNAKEPHPARQQPALFRMSHGVPGLPQ